MNIEVNNSLHPVSKRSLAGNKHALTKMVEEKMVLGVGIRLLILSSLLGDEF